MKRSLISALALALCLVFASAASAEENGLNVNTATQQELAAVPILAKDYSVSDDGTISGAECNC